MKRKPNKVHVMYLKEHYALLGSLTVLLFLFAAYMYFVSASIVHVVIRKEVNQEIVLLSSHISELESEYIALQHAVSQDMASQNGFVAVRDKIYIDRNAGALVLSQNEEDDG